MGIASLVRSLSLESRESRIVRENTASNRSKRSVEQQLRILELEEQVGSLWSGSPSENAAIIFGGNPGPGLVSNCSLVSVSPPAGSGSSWQHNSQYSQPTSSCQSGHHPDSPPPSSLLLDPCADPENTQSLGSVVDNDGTSSEPLSLSNRSASTNSEVIHGRRDGQASAHHLLYAHARCSSRPGGVRFEDKVMIRRIDFEHGAEVITHFSAPLDITERAPRTETYPRKFHLFGLADMPAEE